MLFINQGRYGNMGYRDMAAAVIVRFRNYIPDAEDVTFNSILEMYHGYIDVKLEQYGIPEDDIVSFMSYIGYNPASTIQ